MLVLAPEWTGSSTIELSLWIANKIAELDLYAAESAVLSGLDDGPAVPGSYFQTSLRDNMNRGMTSQNNRSLLGRKRRSLRESSLSASAGLIRRKETVTAISKVLEEFWRGKRTNRVFNMGSKRPITIQRDEV